MKESLMSEDEKSLEQRLDQDIGRRLERLSTNLDEETSGALADKEKGLLERAKEKANRVKVSMDN